MEERGDRKSTCVKPFRYGTPTGELRLGDTVRPCERELDRIGSAGIKRRGNAERLPTRVSVDSVNLPAAEHMISHA